MGFSKAEQKDIRRRHIKNMQRFNSWAENNQCTVMISYPRSGREWIWRLMNQITGLPVVEIYADTEYEYSKYAYFFWHGYWHQQFISEKARSNIKVVQLIRDPRDCVLSAAYRRITHGLRHVMDISLVDESTADCCDPEKGFTARFGEYMGFNVVETIQYERLCLSPVGEIQKLLDCINVTAQYPTDLSVKKMDSHRWIEFVEAGKNEDNVKLRVEKADYRTGSERYEDHCLKWKVDDLFRRRHRRAIWESCKDKMEMFGYTEIGHDLEKIECGVCDMGPYAMSPDLINLLRGLLPIGASVAELGSGAGTAELSKTFKMQSVEHNRQWTGLYNSEYIHAPLVDGWYNPRIIKRNLKPGYKALIVDGPHGSERRALFINHADIFDLQNWIIFDDIHRDMEYACFMKLTNELGRSYGTYVDDRQRAFGVIVPAGQDLTKLTEAALKLGLTAYIGGEQGL